MASLIQECGCHGSKCSVGTPETAQVSIPIVSDCRQKRSDGDSSTLQGGAPSLPAQIIHNIHTVLDNNEEEL